MCETHTFETDQCKSLLSSRRNSCFMGHNRNYKRAILLSVLVSHTDKLNTAWCVAAALTAALTLLLPIKRYSVGKKSKIPSCALILPLFHTIITIITKLIPVQILSCAEIDRKCSHGTRAVLACTASFPSPSSNS